MFWHRAEHKGNPDGQAMCRHQKIDAAKERRQYTVLSGTPLF
jgi:hypothetical protein